MRIYLDDDKQADETWLELTVQEVWDSVKRVRRKSGRRQEVHTLTFGATVIEITVKRVQP